MVFYLEKDKFAWKLVLVCWASCYNKIQHTGHLAKQKFLSRSARGWQPKVKVSEGWFLLRLHSLACIYGGLLSVFSQGLSSVRVYPWCPFLFL